MAASTFIFVFIGVSVVTTVAAKVATVSGDEITYETKTAMEV